MYQHIIPMTQVHHHLVAPCPNHVLTRVDPVVPSIDMYAQASPVRKGEQNSMVMTMQNQVWGKEASHTFRVSGWRAQEAWVFEKLSASKPKGQTRHGRLRKEWMVSRL